MNPEMSVSIAFAYMTYDHQEERKEREWTGKKGRR